MDWLVFGVIGGGLGCDGLCLPEMPFRFGVYIFAVDWFGS